ncbi:deoxycytidylate deaminase [Fervidicella metallireducens AeB]|uniref:tRNA-specific adenosine deaminase n=2 Tax=Fervidicella TaxID=1403538 RepID=A0A017RTS8_9CLOT|nr:tRNA adenosine(34) deaminase TadA [Fervidicella metallireducens]EYE88042.1 deoxycytidylate deaminase [Fervidicella metallireducens AeB]
MDEYYMRLAIEEAKKAAMLDEVPVGVVVVRKGNILVRSHNCREILKDSTAHAEILAIKEACKILNGWRLLDCEMYVTLEPCPMCAGAIVNSRIKKLVFGAYDNRSGACKSLYNITQDERLNHRLEVIGGVLEEDCKKLMQEFFKIKRSKCKEHKK